MKIGIDISQIAYEGTGVARFTNGLTKAICTYGKDHEWVFFFSSLRNQLPPDIQIDIENSNNKLVNALLPPTLLSFLWNNLHALPVDLVTGKLDWFITSDWTEAPANCKKATVIHDLTYLRYPSTVHPKILKTQSSRMKWVEKESNIIFTDSQATFEDCIKYLRINKNKLHINYPGVNKPQVPTSTQEIVKSFQLKRPYILSVGKLEPRKNLNALIDTYIALNPAEIDLVIVGPTGWDVELSTRIASHKDKIHILGYISDDELTALYKESFFFIFPSIWEGFGYPLVEAMSLGVPTASSNTSSLYEIGKDASLQFDPHKVDEIKNVMKKLIEDDKLRSTLAKKGLTRAKDFSWKKYFENMISVLEKNA